MQYNFASKAAGDCETLELASNEVIPQFDTETVIATKSWVIAEHKWLKNDGNVMLTFINMRVKLLHIRMDNGNLVTDIIAQFDQYNNTENDKGDHHCSIRIFINDANTQALAVPYPNINITRDACRQLPTTFLPQVRLGTDFYDITEGFGWSGTAGWNYEGGC